jgi:hypothetical protein
MENNGTLSLSSGSGDVHVLQVVLTALSRYTWLVPVILGVPGNAISVLIANRKHNKKLSPCIYMTGMAVADTAFLLEVAWFYSTFYVGLLDNFFVSFKQAEIVYQ